MMSVDAKETSRSQQTYNGSARFTKGYPIHINVNSLVVSSESHMFFSIYSEAALRGSAGLITTVLLSLLCTAGKRHHRPPD